MTTTRGKYSHCAPLPDIREALEAMPRDIAESVDPIMLVHPAMHVVRDTLHSHVAVPMSARTDVVPSLADTESVAGLGRCPVAICGLRLPFDPVHVDKVAGECDLTVAVSCKTCRRIVESINSALLPSISEGLA